VGDPVNLEVDVLAKYTERLLARGPGPNTHPNTSNGGG
jgi:riboflavin synthase alpha subunit